MTDVQVTVLVDDEHLASIADVAAALQSAGLSVGAVHAQTGTITGTVSRAVGLSSLQGVEGVAAVEPARGFQLPPPDAPVQ